MIKESYLASCWIEGEPTKDGLYLLRLDAFRNANDPWFHIYECRIDTFLEKKSRGTMMYFDNHGGNRAGDYHITTKGRITHHCCATGDNFQSILSSMAEMTFDKEKMDWVPV